MLQQSIGQYFIDENPPVLRIITELHDVELVVVCFDEVSLRAAAHFPNESAGVYRHVPWRVPLAGSLARRAHEYVVVANTSGVT